MPVLPWGDRWTLHRRLVHRPLQSRCRVRASALMGALGIGLIIFVDSPGSLGCLLYSGDWVPRWASRDHFCRQRYRPRCTNPRQCGTTTGYLAFLVGPPLLGYLGEIMDYVVQCWLYWRWLFSRLFRESRRQTRYQNADGDGEQLRALN